MDQAIYMGTEHPELVGESAIVWPHPERTDLLLAQFNDVLLFSPTIQETRPIYQRGSNHSGLAWGLGWHALPVRDMPLVIPIPVSL